VTEDSIADHGADVDPVAVFKKRLQQFQVDCGGPSIRDLERLFAKVGRPQSRSVIQAKLTGRTKPDWAFVESFVEACVLHAGTGRDPDLPMWRDHHNRMQVALARRRAAAPAGPTPPATPAGPTAPAAEPGDPQLAEEATRPGDPHPAAPAPRAGNPQPAPEASQLGDPYRTRDGAQPGNPQPTRPENPQPAPEAARPGDPQPASRSGWGELARARADLAAVIARQWAAEAEARSLYRPDPVRVRWSRTRRPVMPADATPGSARPRWPDSRGELSDLVAQFRRLPTRQMVVIGEPGAGKTVAAIVLTLGLLRDPEPGDPVPVLLTVAGWNPHREHLQTWLARRITEEYPGLANTKIYGPDAAKRLVADGHILPVLDGLDETSPDLCAAAIDALDRASGGGRPFVVTCRREQYEEAVQREGVILASALVVEIEPVVLADAAEFLMARQRQGDTRWATVLDHLRAHPDAPLAQALSTPLMVDLARSAYAGVTADPGELIDSARFPSRTAIEEHLLDSFLPNAYAQGPRPPAAADRPVAAQLYTPAQAQGWLAFLARHLTAGQTRDISWWTMISGLPPLTRGLVLGLPASLAFFLTGLLAGGPLVGAVYGLATAAAGVLANGFASRPEPQHVEMRFRGTGARFAGRFAIGIAIGVALGLGWSLSVGLIALLALVFGAGIGLHVWLEAPAEVNRVADPVLNLRQDRLAAYAFALSYAMSLGLFYGVANTFTEQQRFLPVFGGHFDLALALAGALAGALMGRFTFGLLGGTVYALAGAAMGGMVFPAGGRLSSGLVEGALFGLGAALMVLPGRAWGDFVACRLLLAARGQMPLRLMSFLEDAHQRGVLRQAGAVYQFRHARLQDRLVSDGQRGPSSEAAAS